MRLSLPPLALLAALLLWTGCDTSEPQVDPPDEPAVAAAAAAAVASSVGIAPGGALFDVAEAALALDALRQPGRFAAAGCEGERAWDEATATWRQDLACERGRADGPLYARFARAFSFALADADGQPVQRPAEAASAEVAFAGDGARRGPLGSHTLSEVAARLALTGLDADRLVVNGASSRTATDSLRTRDGLRTFAYTLTLGLEDVTGPRRPRPLAAAWWTPPAEWGLADAHRAWAGAVGGTVTGRLVGTMTWEADGETRSRDVDQAFSVAFDGEGAATVRLGGASFTVDLVTGGVR